MEKTKQQAVRMLMMLTNSRRFLSTLYCLFWIRSCIWDSPLRSSDLFIRYIYRLALIDYNNHAKRDPLYLPKSQKTSSYYGQRSGFVCSGRDWALESVAVYQQKGCPLFQQHPEPVQIVNDSTQRKEIQFAIDSDITLAKLRYWAVDVVPDSCQK